jgi:hypothetical protein
VDILKVLAFNNDHRVRETVVSSIFNFLLNPRGDHGFGSSFLCKYLDALKGHLPFINKGLLDGIEAFAKNDDLDIEVLPEYASGTEGDLKNRRLDSLLRIRNKDQLYLIGTEVKIYGDSAADKDQLDAYAELLVAQKNIAVEEEGFDEVAINAALVYLVPGDSGKAFSFAATSSKYCESLGIHGVVIVPWWSPDTGKTKIEAGHKVVEIAMDQLLRELLISEVQGDISPVDAQAADVVRCLRNASLKHFDFSVPVSNASDARFPTNTDYEDALEPDQKILLEEFRNAAISMDIKRPLTASTRNTSIGIPFKPSPQKGVNNTLCRIETVESYKTGTPRTSFVLELSRKIYEKDITVIKEALTSSVLKGLVDDRQGQYHENGKDDEEVIRIKFTETESELSDDERAQMTKQFQALIGVLKRIFQSSMS